MNYFLTLEIKVSQFSGIIERCNINCVHKVTKFERKGIYNLFLILFVGFSVLYFVRTKIRKIYLFNLLDNFQTTFEITRKLSLSFQEFVGLKFINFGQN